jgi:predicted component of type VI protein secretion system
MASLWITTGPGAGQSVSVIGELIIGRQNADLTLDDAEVSRRHAAVRLDGGRLEIEDLGSANGTFVNGSRIEGAVTVGGGAKIRIGQTEMEVRGVVPIRADTPIADPQATQTRPIADPQVTQARAVPDPQVTKARPVADPQVTQARAIPDPQVTKARPVADPQVTQARAIPDPQVTKARPVADPQVTKARPVADPQVTRARAIPERQPPSRSVPDSPPPAGPTPAAPAPRASKDIAAEVGSFSPGARRRRGRGLASRSWVPTVASFASAAAAAAALVVYFVVHGVPS